MCKKTKLSALILLASLISAPFSSYAAAEAGVPKEVWLKKFKELAPAAMCNSMLSKGASKQALETRHIDYDKCMPLITTSMNTCLSKYSQSMPSNFNLPESQKWGKEIGTCSGADFYVKNIK